MTRGEIQIRYAIRNQPAGLCRRGIKHYFGVDVPNYPRYCFIANDRTAGLPSLPDTGRADGFNRPGPILPGWKLVHILPELTRHAVKWVEDSARSGQPFFLYFTLTSPHHPVVPSPEFKGKSAAGDYGDFVMQTDWTVGRVLDALRRTGVADNTFVVFASDNGPEVTGEVNPGAYDRAQQFRPYSMGELRGAKPPGAMAHRGSMIQDPEGAARLAPAGLLIARGLLSSTDKGT